MNKKEIKKSVFESKHKTNMGQKRNTKTKQKARFISYIFFEVLFQNLKKQNIRAGNWGGSFFGFLSNV